MTHPQPFTVRDRRPNFTGKDIYVHCRMLCADGPGPLHAPLPSKATMKRVPSVPNSMSLRLPPPVMRRQLSQGSEEQRSPLTNANPRGQPQATKAARLGCSPAQYRQRHNSAEAYATRAPAAGEPVTICSPGTRSKSYGGAVSNNPEYVPIVRMRKNSRGFCPACDALLYI